jgi:diguanylate cyclase (GGDEF)-like protein
MDSMLKYYRKEACTMEIKQGIGEVLLSGEATLLLYWSVEDGWKLVSDNCPLAEHENLNLTGLMGLRSIVDEDDRRLFDIYAQKILSGMHGANPFTIVQESLMEVSLRLKNNQGSSEYHRLECYLKKDEEGAIDKLVIRIFELSQEEVYRLRLIQETVNNGHPEVFAEGVSAMLEQNPDLKFALVQFDVSNFKMINEQYGEAFGDEMLEYFSRSLKILCGKNQLFTRLAADVFNVLTPYETEEELLEFVDYLREHLLCYRGISYRLVFGICTMDGSGKELRRYNDSAAYARRNIKEDAMSYVAFYKDDLKKSIRMTKYIEDNMEKALLNHEFVMYLQPKYSISDERLIGAEALVRWADPERGIIPPKDFVPLFEKNGFVIKMDHYIWEEACKTIRAWMDEGLEPIPISVNVSRRHLFGTQFIQVLDYLIDKYQIPKSYLELEITESTEAENVNDSIRLLKSRGYTLLMDDFGSGYSSLNMLKDTQFDIIKIDRGFLQNLIGSDRGRSIVEHTIQMTKDIGLDTIAEGVETREEADFLSQCGCDKAQGFYYARPVCLELFNNRYRSEMIKN